MLVPLYSAPYSRSILSVLASGQDHLLSDKKRHVAHGNGIKYRLVAENWVLYSAGRNCIEYRGTIVKRCIIFYQQNKDIPRRTIYT